MDFFLLSRSFWTFADFWDCFRILGDFFADSPEFLKLNCRVFLKIFKSKF